MRRSLACFLPFVLAPHALAQGKPIDLAAVRDDQFEYWAVPVTVGSKTGLFLVSLNHRESLISRSWLGGAKPKMSLGGIDVGECAPVADERFTMKVAGKSIVGALGCDALAHLALGFDYIKSTVRLWKDLKSQEVTAFVDGETASVPLKRLASGVPAVEAKRAGKTFDLELCPYGTLPVLRGTDRLPQDVTLTETFGMGLQGRVESPTPLVATADLSFGQFHPAWAYYTPLVDIQSDTAQGGFPVVPYDQPKTIVDLKKNVLYLRSYSPDEEVANALSSILNTTVYLRGDAIMMGSGDVRLQKGTPDPWRDAEVIEFANLDAKAVLTAMRGQDRLSYLGRLHDLALAGFTVTAKPKGESFQTLTYKVPAKPMPTAASASAPTAKSVTDVTGTDIPALFDSDRVAYAVPVTVGGKVGYFLVALEFRDSAVSDEWLGDSESNLIVGGRPAGIATRLPASQLSVQVDGHPIVGFLGNGGLLDCAIGFDAEGKRVTLWPKPDPAVLSKFLGGDVVRIPLTFRPSGTPTLKANLDGHEVTLVLSAHDNEMRLRPDLLRPEDPTVDSNRPKGIDGKDGPVTNVLVKPSLEVGPLHLPWVFYESTFVDQPPELAGTYPIHTTVQNRVVVDLSGKALVLSPTTEAERIVTDLTRLTSVPMRLRDGKLVFDTTDGNDAWAVLKPYEGKELRTIAGIDVRAFLTTLQGADRLKAFKTIIDATKKGYVIDFLNDPASPVLSHLNVKAKT